MAPEQQVSLPGTSSGSAQPRNRTGEAPGRHR